MYTLKLTKCKCDRERTVKMYHFKRERISLPRFPAGRSLLAQDACNRPPWQPCARSQTKNAANSFVRRVNCGPEHAERLWLCYFKYLTGITTESHESSAIPRTTGELQVSTNYIRMFLFDRPVIYQAGRLGRGRSHSRKQKKIYPVILQPACCRASARRYLHRWCQCGGQPVLVQKTMQVAASQYPDI